MFTVYAIYNRLRNKIYIGHTSDLETRLKRHNKLLPINKKSFTSKNSGKWVLVHKEEFSTREEAIRREKELKSYRGREFIRDKIKSKFINRQD